MNDRLRVCIDARIEPGMWGGVEPYIMQVGRALLDLRDGNEEYVFLVHEQSADWVRQRISPEAPLIFDGPRVSSRRTGRPGNSALLRAACSPRRFLGVLRQRRDWDHAARTEPWRRVRNTTPGSSGAIERADVHLIHFMHQNGFVTEIPSIYQPHDFQHCHLPELFSPEVIAARHGLYPRLCHQAAAIVTVSSWVKDDTVRWTGVNPDKVWVLPYPPPLGGYGEPTPTDINQVQTRFGIPPTFFYYAAQTWPHKNHINLLRAVAHLRDSEGLRVPVVCSGQKNDYFQTIQAEIQRLGLHDLAFFVGFVTPLEVRCLYAMSRAVTIPTRFEAASYPMWEAFREERAVACSNATSLPLQAGDAGLLFNPDDPLDIAVALKRLWTDESLRARLTERGRANLARFTPERSARAFRALYRRLTNRPLTEQDAEILKEPPLL